MGFARSVATEIVFMESGVIQETGTPAEVFGEGGGFERIRSFMGQIGDLSGD